MQQTLIITKLLYTKYCFIWLFQWYPLHIRPTFWQVSFITNPVCHLQVVTVTRAYSIRMCNHHILSCFLFLLLRCLDRFAQTATKNKDECKTGYDKRHSGMHIFTNLVAVCANDKHIRLSSRPCWFLWPLSAIRSTPQVKRRNKR